MVDGIRWPDLRPVSADWTALLAELRCLECDGPMALMGRAQRREFLRFFIRGLGLGEHFVAGVFCAACGVHALVTVKGRYYVVDGGLVRAIAAGGPVNVCLQGDERLVVVSMAEPVRG